MGDSNFKITYFRYLLEALSSGGGGGGLLPIMNYTGRLPPKGLEQMYLRGFSGEMFCKSCSVGI